MSAGICAARSALVPLAAFACAWGVSRALTAARDDAGRSPPGLAAPPAAAQYDSATLAIQDALTPAAAEALRPDMPAGVGLLVVLRDADVRACEDLGRQLRELQTRIGRMPMVAVTPTESVEVLRAFLRRERVRAAVRPGDPGLLLQSTPGLPTPAVFMVREQGGIVRGISHPRRFSNARVRSFADELATRIE
jgi:hypothetical protein